MIVNAQLVENARKKMAQERFDWFCRYVEIPGAPVNEQDADSDHIGNSKRLSAPLASCHQLLADKLQKVEEGEIKRLMIFCPPGMAKSTYGSLLFPTWFMARKRNRNVICATYGSDFATKIGRRARGIVKQSAFDDLFGISLSQDSQAADNWVLTNGSEYLVGGIQSGITGNRADLIVIDDPVKNRSEADSETVRNKIWEEWEATIKTRAKPQCRYVIIQTRWHEDDLSGRLLPEDWKGESGQILCRDGQYWEIVCLSAEATGAVDDKGSIIDPLGRQKGEMIWPEWFDADHWVSARTNLRNWYALYQQQPSGEGGLEFKREWFQNMYEASEVPKTLNVYMTSDHAPSGNGDYNCFRIWGIDMNRNLWLLDSVHKRCKMIEAFGVAMEKDKLTIQPGGVFAMMKKWKPQKWFPERDSTFLANEQIVEMWMRQLSVRTRVESQPTRMTGAVGKVGKASAYIDMCRLGMVHLPDTNEGHDTIEEYLAFPAGRHDDRVDSDGMIGRVMGEMRAAVEPTVPIAKKAPDKYKVIQTVATHSQSGFY